MIQNLTTFFIHLKKRQRRKIFVAQSMNGFFREVLSTGILVNYGLTQLAFSRF